MTTYCSSANLKKKPTHADFFNTYFSLRLIFVSTFSKQLVDDIGIVAAFSSSRYRFHAVLASIGSEDDQSITSR